MYRTTSVRDVAFFFEGREDEGGRKGIVIGNRTSFLKTRFAPNDDPLDIWQLLQWQSSVVRGAPRRENVTAPQRQAPWLSWSSWFGWGFGIVIASFVCLFTYCLEACL